ncbi:phosphoethanolamine transferase [Morganella morganii]|uniref:phosphoethanolamine transferase n=1 Tax=Morganella morganii TaxID=582 RepID=UPI00128B5188|nr:phosphoethanolamine transferase [Morganella morganii]MQC08418.1 hypothetical protein [Morganella morganii]MQC11555.1 hypothetical protein [Morganella morganii]MQC15836.1 hypothetical protein [Morganella morganii]
MTTNKPILKKITLSLLALIVIFYTSKLMLKGVGSHSSEGSAFLLSILIIIFNSSKKAFWFVIFPITLLYAIYSPIGLIFGSPNYQYVASIFATDLLESKEFFSQLPLYNYLCPFIIIFGLLLFRFLTVKYKIDFYKNKTVLCIFIFFALLDQSPFSYFKTVIDSAQKVKDELVNLNYTKAESTWGESVLTDKSTYDTYVLVIGESARKDYHSAYGYPVINTPFISTEKGLLVDGLTSGGPNTISSLRLMLTHPDKNNWEPDYTKSFIDLVNSAGIETYWISNQGYIGEFDTPITAIAKNSTHKKFLKYNEYKSKNTSDFQLLPSIREAIESHPRKKKLIVVHLYGSHPQACDRINDYKLIVPVQDQKYSYLNCYISSINKTDDFLKEIYGLLENEYKTQHASFSMIYFSDHGLAHREIDGVIHFNNNRQSKLHYEIPLFMTSSDAAEHKACKSSKSGLNFTDGIAGWLGIKNAHLQSDYSLFDCQDDPDDYGLREKIQNFPEELDPAIDIRGK